MLKILCLEDSPQDVEIMRELLTDAGFDLSIDIAAIEKDYASFLRGNAYDIILSDFKLPGFDGFTALRLAREICPKVPFICVSGTIGEEAAVDLLKQGAVDYVLKDRLARLPLAIKRALDQATEKERRRQAEEALSESERKLNEAQKMAQLGNWTWDVTTGSVEWSEEVFNIFQLDPKAFTPQIDSILSLSPWPEDHERDKELIRRAMESQEKGSYEQRFLRPDNSVGYYYSTFHGKYDEGGNLIFIVGTVQDITERKRAEAILRESESRAIAMFQAIPDMIFRLDRQGIFLDYKADVKDLYAQSDPTIIGKRNRDITPPEFADLIDRKIHDALVSNTLQTFEYHLPAPGSGMKNFEARMVVSGVDEVTAIVRDITERKRTEEALRESEERFRSLYENSTIGLYRTTPDGKIILANPTLVKMLGYSNFEELALRNLEQEGFEPSYERKHFIEQIELHGEVRGLETVWNRKDGSIVHIRESARVIRDLNGKTLYYDGSVEDITERKRAEEEVRESEEKFRMVFENVFDGISIYSEDPDPSKRRLIECNEQYAAMAGRSREELLQLGTTLGLQKAIENEANANRIESLSQKTVFQGSFSWIRPDGKANNVEYVAMPITWQGKSYSIGIDRDITERKQVEKALQVSMDRYKNLTNISPVGIFNTDENGLTTYVNPTYCQISGLSFEEALGNGWLRVVHPDDKEKLFKGWQEATRLYHESFSDYRFMRPDGTIAWVMGQAIPETNSENKIIGYLGTITDITERKRAEEMVRESEERFRSLYENSTIGLYRTTPDGKIILANPTLVKMLGYSTFEELASRNLEQEGFEPSYERKHFIEQIELNGEVKGLESAWTRKDGSMVYIRESARTIRDPNGKTLYYDGSVEDITERKQAEVAFDFEKNLLRSLMDNVPDNIYFKDLNSRFLRMSKSLAERIGLSDPAQAIGKTDFDFFTDDNARPAYVNEQEIIKTGIPLVNMEEKETWPGGLEKWVSTTKVPLRDVEGHIIGTFGISRDMTEQKKLQSLLLQTQKVQSIGTLAGGIAHDFNNILGIILAFTSVLERSDGNKEKILKSTTAITQAVSRGAALVRQILTFARQTGALVKPLFIPDLIREIVNMLKETFPGVIEFKTVIENNVPFINADHSQMHQVLLNLCVNARDAMPKGGIIGIEVRTVASETLIQQFPETKNDRYISISVSDTGTGMDEATKSRIFDPFFTTKEQGKGTGLGLSVVYGVVQDHHGFIAVESKAGQGTTFHLYIPVPQEEKETQEIKNTKADGEQRGSETILFVEDEQLLREVIQSVLETNGYKVLLANNGREAVEIYKKEYKDIALVLSDMGLPKLGGRDVYAMLKEINPHIKIIFASGFISQETRSELYKEGVKGFIMKPYGVHEVLHMVREVLNENGKK